MTLIQMKPAEDTDSNKNKNTQSTANSEMLKVLRKIAMGVSGR